MRYFVANIGNKNTIQEVMPDKPFSADLDLLGDFLMLRPTAIWMPDNKRILFVASLDRSSSATTFLIMDDDGKHTRPFFKDAGIYASAPEFSPDGKLLLFIHHFLGSNSEDSTISVSNADGSNIRDLTDSKTVRVGIGLPTWSPDSEEIAFGTYTYADDDVHIHVMNVDGTYQRSIFGPIHGLIMSLTWHMVLDSYKSWRLILTKTLYNVIIVSVPSAGR